MLQPSQASKANLLRILRSRRESLYGLFDAARSPTLRSTLFNSQEHYQSLYSGEMAKTLSECAPYLVLLPKQSLLVDELIAHGWENAWGYYVISTYSFDEVRMHL